MGPADIGGGGLQGGQGVGGGGVTVGGGVVGGGVTDTFLQNLPTHPPIDRPAGCKGAVRAAQAGLGGGGMACPALFREGGRSSGLVPCALHLAFC